MYNFEGLLEFYRGGGGGKIGCQSECNTERGFIDSLSKGLGSGLEEWFWKRKTSLMDLFLA